MVRLYTRWSATARDRLDLRQAETRVDLASHILCVARPLKPRDEAVREDGHEHDHEYRGGRCDGEASAVAVGEPAARW